MLISEVHSAAICHQCSLRSNSLLSTAHRAKQVLHSVLVPTRTQRRISTDANIYIFTYFVGHQRDALLLCVWHLRSYAAVAYPTPTTVLRVNKINPTYLGTIGAHAHTCARTHVSRRSASQCVDTRNAVFWTFSSTRFHCLLLSRCDTTDKCSATESNDILNLQQNRPLAKITITL
jgi:hypothetical protein